MKFFVIMPSGKHKEYNDGTEEADFIYREIICKAINLAVQEYSDMTIKEASIEREIDELSPGAINKSIVRKTYYADYVIVDITGANPNVFFELGLRYTFKPSGTILIRQKDSYIPFDINAYRCIDYDPKYFGPQKAVLSIKETILSLLEKNQVDSLVYDTFPFLDLTIDKKYAKEPEKNNAMPWSEYWGKFTTCLEILKSSNYKPDYIIGISNGGMFLADTVSRLLYPDIPIASFWAHRTQPQKNYFKHPINEAVIKILSKSDKEIIKLLVFDDIVATGGTWVKLKDFFKLYLKNYSIVFIPLFSRSKKYLSSIVDDTLWGHEIFHEHLPKSMSFDDFCYTEYLHLPYSKDINFNK